MTMRFLAALTLLVASVSVNATQITSGTSTFLTFRDCVSYGATACDNISSTIAYAVDGDPGDASSSTSMSDESHGSVSGSATLNGSLGSTTLTGSANSDPGARISTNTFALQRFTYTGSMPATLYFGAVLNYDQSVPAENAGFDPSFSQGLFSGASGGIEIFTLSDSFLEAGVTALDNFYSLNGGFSLAPGYTSLASASYGATNLSGSGSEILTASVSLNPNDSVWLYSFLQTPGANGASVTASLNSAATVPEPETLALFALGMITLLIGRSRRA